MQIYHAENDDIIDGSQSDTQDVILVKALYIQSTSFHYNLSVGVDAMSKSSLFSTCSIRLFVYL